MLPNNAAARTCRGITVEADDLADSLSTGQSTQHAGCGGMSLGGCASARMVLSRKIGSEQTIWVYHMGGLVVASRII